MSEFASGFLFAIGLIVVMVGITFVSVLYEEWRGPVLVALRFAKKEGFRRMRLRSVKHTWAGVTLNPPCSYYHYEYVCSGVRGGSRVAFKIHVMTPENSCRLELLAAPVVPAPA
jgi:hypothetical protein